MNGTPGDTIRKARWQAQLSQPELAEKAGVSVTTLSRIENGVNIPRGLTRARLAEALGLDLDALLEDSA